MFLCNEKIALVLIYFPLSIYSETIKCPNNNCNNNAIETFWNLYDDKTFLISNIGNLSASTWSQNTWPVNSNKRITSAALPLNFNAFEEIDKTDHKIESTIDENSYENERKHENHNKDTRQHDQLSSSKKGANLNAGMFLVSLLKMMDFDANKLGSLTLNVLIMIGQAVSF